MATEEDMKLTKYVREHKYVLIGIGIILLSVTCLFWVSFYIASDTLNWLKRLEDPTERGLAYVALSIVFYTIFHKTNINVENKLNERNRTDS